MHQHLPLSRTATAVIATGLALALAGCGKAADPLVSSPATPGGGVNVSDIDINEHVKTALHQAAALQGKDITVATSKGDVRLTGVLDTQAQIDEALRIARAAEGAHAVHDELVIRK